MRIFYKKAVPTVLSLSLAAAVAVSAAGCAAGSGSEDSEEEVITVYVTNVDPYAGTEAEDGPDTTAGSAEEADTSSSFGTGAFPAAADMTGEEASPASETTAASETGDSGSETASTGASSAEESSSIGSGLNAPVPAGSVGTFTGAGAGDHEEDSGSDGTDDGAPFALDGGTDVYSEPEEEEEDPGKEDTSLRESVLREALTDCTGWGQSAGSSLRAAYAASQLLRWANQADAGQADADLLEKTVSAEFDDFSSEEKETIRDNWSSISYDASMILDDYDEISYLLEDAGCSETAKEAAQDQNALSNWKAAEKALKAAMK